jgi:hypothetical protein
VRVKRCRVHHVERLVRLGKAKGGGIALSARIVDAVSDVSEREVEVRVRRLDRSLSKGDLVGHDIKTFIAARGLQIAEQPKRGPAMIAPKLENG